MGTKFEKYTPTKKESKIVELWEIRTGFELLYTDEVIDSKSLKECLSLNIRWLEDWVLESTEPIRKHIRS